MGGFKWSAPMGQTSPRREKAPSRPHQRPAMWYLSSWRNLPWRSHAGHGLLNKPEITPPSHSNHRRDGTPSHVGRVREHKAPRASPDPASMLMAKLRVNPRRIESPEAWRLSQK